MGGAKPISILYAEDDPVSARVLGRTLQHLGYCAHGFPDGHQAMDWFTVHQPPIIISDWMMPGMDGLEFCARIRAANLPQYTYFVLLTANVGEENYRKAMESGVDDFLAKPFERNDLLIRLRVAERIMRQRWDAEAKIRSLAHFPADNPNPILQANREGIITYANQSSMPLLGELGCALGGPLPSRLQELVASHPLGERRTETELSCHQRTFSFGVTSVSEDGLVYLYGHDISARKRAETELISMRNQAVAQSLQDALTGIGNRVLFQQQLPRLIEQAQGSGSQLALVIVDIDNFKEINDGHGHKVGDQVIIHVGHTLRDNLKASDCVCRWGGDELVMLIPELPGGESMPQICERLSSAVKQGAAESDLPPGLTLSMGYALFPQDADSGEMLLQRADQALYKAKGDGRDCFRAYVSDGRRPRGGMNLFQRLTLALQEGRITAHFQPVWDVINRRVAGVEALARWKDPELGFVPPDEFIPLAEGKGLIVQLSRQVLEAGFSAMTRWRDAGLDLSLSLNLSKRQLVDNRFLMDLSLMVSRGRLPHHQIIFEVTERQSILGNSIGRQRLEEMARLGFRLSLDDFGSGYSSFDLVGEIPFHELKIYSGLINRMDQPRGKGIVQAVVDMGHTLGLTVVAEGVETGDQVRRLREMGIHKIQGYHYSPPLPLEELLVYVARTLDSTPPDRPAHPTTPASQDISF